MDALDVAKTVVVTRKGIDSLQRSFVIISVNLRDLCYEVMMLHPFCVVAKAVKTSEISILLEVLPEGAISLQLTIAYLTSVT